MATEPRSFRLTDEDRSRLRDLAHDLGWNSTDVVRLGLVALRALIQDGYEFRGFFPDVLVLRQDDAGVTFFEIGPTGAFVKQSRAEWEGS